MRAGNVNVITQCSNPQGQGGLHNQAMRHWSQIKSNFIDKANFFKEFFTAFSQHPSLTGTGPCTLLPIFTSLLPFLRYFPHSKLHPLEDTGKGSEERTQGRRNRQKRRRNRWNVHKENGMSLLVPVSVWNDIRLQVGMSFKIVDLDGFLGQSRTEKTVA